MKAYGYPGGTLDVVDAKPTNAIANMPDGLPFDSRLAFWLEGRVAPGFSGGPILDRSGGLVGMTIQQRVKGEVRTPFFVALGRKVIAAVTASTMTAGRMLFEYPETTEIDDEETRSAIVNVYCWTPPPPPPELIPR